MSAAACQARTCMQRSKPNMRIIEVAGHAKEICTSRQVYFEKKAILNFSISMVLNVWRTVDQTTIDGWKRFPLHEKKIPNSCKKCVRRIFDYTFVVSTVLEFPKIHIGIRRVLRPNTII